MGSVCVESLPGAPDIRHMRDAIPGKDHTRGGEVYLPSGLTIMMPGPWSRAYGTEYITGGFIGTAGFGLLGADANRFTTLWHRARSIFYLQYINDLDEQNMRPHLTIYPPGSPFVSVGGT